MTLAIAVVSHKCIWMCADRRLSRIDGPGQPRDRGPLPLATKLVLLETSDSKGVISYAGYGARLDPMFEISEWLRRTLRELDLDLNDTLNVIAEEATRNSIDKLLPTGHIFLYAGFRNGTPHVESIATPQIAFESRPMRPGPTTLVQPDRSQRFNRHPMGLATADGIGRVVIGSGASSVKKNMFSGIKNYIDFGSVGGVSSRLAAAVCSVGRELPGSVSQESVCVSIHTDGTTSFRAFDGSGRGSTDVVVPVLARGMDTGSLAAVVAPIMSEHFARIREAKAAGLPEPEVDADGMNEALGARAVDFTRDTKF